MARRQRQVQMLAPEKPEDIDLNTYLEKMLFALLRNKSSVTYGRLFRAIRDELKAMPFRLDLDEGPKRKSIVIDYEQAVINTVATFTFRKQSDDKFKRTGSLFSTRNDDEFSRSIRMVLALAFVPRESIKDAWQTLLHLESFNAARD
ncbi:hypothetical protein RvY_13327 [Ramazzottius varieornatus]|uniref:Uncharacterized protein n=1 Tax=Ramazzottius varieornatus TaxID=947166 RepID=A0A1D1VMJ2_RAMVA|nr:hypothetical protein RvY_13327 [Ramazzottius varieornatus]